MAPSYPRSVPYCQRRGFLDVTVVPYCQQIIANVSGMLSPIQWPSMNRTLNSKACKLTSRLLASYTSPDAKHLDHALSAGLRLSAHTKPGDRVLSFVCQSCFTLEMLLRRAVLPNDG